LHRRAALRADAVLHVRREIAQVVVARADFDPRVGDADERLLEIGVREADRLQHRARARAARPGGERIAHETTSHGSGRADAGDAFHAGYEPSVRSIGANSARWLSARAQTSVSRADARSA